MGAAVRVLLRTADTEFGDMTEYSRRGVPTAKRDFATITGMRISGVLARNEETLPGLVGVARIQREPGELPRKLKPGDVAVIDETDLGRATAEALVQAQVGCVVNLAQSISGRYPNPGPDILLSAGIPLVDDVGTGLLRSVRDGTKLRVHGGSLYTGEKEVARGREQDGDSVADDLIEAKAGMSAQLEAFSANTIEFLRRERALILDGAGVPPIPLAAAGRPFLVVAPGPGHLDELKRLRRYIKDRRPVLVGVEAGADGLCGLGYHPDLVVGDPERLRTDTLRCGAEVVVPAQLDGYAPGLERIQDLGADAVTFPASGNPEDLALLLADDQGAELVVTVGFRASLHEFLDRGRTASNPSTFLTRLRLGSKIVDGSAVVALHRSRSRLARAVLVALPVLLVLAAVVYVLSGGPVPFPVPDANSSLVNAAVDQVRVLFG